MLKNIVWRLLFCLGSYPIDSIKDVISSSLQPTTKPILFGPSVNKLNCIQQVRDLVIIGISLFLLPGTKELSFIVLFFMFGFLFLLLELAMEKFLLLIFENLLFFSEQNFEVRGISITS